MENLKILIDGIEKDVFGIFYIYESKYYFIYTEKEIDENGYVILYMTQIGKETQNTPNGPVDTGYMVGVEVSNPEEQKKVQASVSLIVEDKKNNTSNPQIQYLPMSMLTKLKIVSKKRFRLLKSIMADNFKLTFENTNVTNVVDAQVSTPKVEAATQTLESLAQIDNVISTVDNAPTDEGATALSDIFTNPVQEEPKNEPQQEVVTPIQEAQKVEVPQETPTPPESDNNVIIDYRAKYFEEEDKNKELEAKIEELTQKLNDIKKILE